MSVLYSALLIAQDVADHAEESFELDITETKTLAVVESLIGQVTGMLEGAIGLNRNLIARKYDHYFELEDWEYSSARTLWETTVNQYPVVEIDTAGFTAGISKHAFNNEADRILYTSRHCGLIEYYAGYARTEQVLADFTDGGTGQGSLTDLGTLPPTLPDDIRNVAINGVLMLLAERRQGPGQRTKTFNASVQTSIVQEPISDYIRRMVRERLSHHKVIV